MKNKNVIWLPRGWQPVYIGFCPSEGAWQRAVKKLGVPKLEYPTNDASTTLFERAECNGNCALVSMNGIEERTSIEIIGLLFHEAVHVWQFSRNVMQENEPGIEIEAYSVQAIGQGLLEACEMAFGIEFDLVDRSAKPPAKDVS